jgi:hypothetical protein
MTQSVTFIFSPKTSQKEQDVLLEKIGDWKHVRGAKRLKPGAKNPLVARMGYIMLGEDADIKDILQRLNDFPEIESAEVPAQRFQVSNR